jgi:hypothetical protein
MPTPDDQFVSIANRNQEVFSTAVQSWADSVQSVAGTLATGQSPLPNPTSVVDQFFDLAEEALRNQREFAQQWAVVAVKASEAVTVQVQRAAQSVTANGAEAVADSTAPTARAAGETTAAFDSPARD